MFFASFTELLSTSVEKADAVFANPETASVSRNSGDRCYLGPSHSWPSPKQSSRARRRSVLRPINGWVLGATPGQIQRIPTGLSHPTGFWGAFQCVRKRPPDRFGTASVVGTNCSQMGGLIRRLTRDELMGQNVACCPSNASRRAVVFPPEARPGGGPKLIRVNTEARSEIRHATSAAPKLRGRRGNSTIQHSAARHHSDARTAVRKLRT